MSEQEFQALLSILNRAPMSPAEALWLNVILLRLRPVQQPAPQSDKQEREQ